MDGDAKDLQLKLEGHFSVNLSIDQQVRLIPWCLGGGWGAGGGGFDSTEVTLDFVSKSLMQSAKTQLKELSTRVI